MAIACHLWNYEYINLNILHGHNVENLEACHKAIEFAIDIGFSRLVLEGDNVNVMQAISSQEANISLLGTIVEDIKHLIRGL